MQRTNRRPTTGGFYGYYPATGPDTIVEVTLNDVPQDLTNPPPPAAFVEFIGRDDPVTIESLDGDWTSEAIVLP